MEFADVVDEVLSKNSVTAIGEVKTAEEECKMRLKALEKARKETLS